MHSSLIGKIQKANLYAREPERVSFTDFEATFRGQHDSYKISYQDGRWSCSCHLFPGWGICSHVMALQKLIGPMLPEQAHSSLAAGYSAVANS